jgi:hypothetical protein
MYTEFWWENLVESGNLEDQEDGGIILKCRLENQDVRT